MIERSNDKIPQVTQQSLQQLRLPKGYDVKTQFHQPYQRSFELVLVTQHLYDRLLSLQ